MGMTGLVLVQGFILRKLGSFRSKHNELRENVNKFTLLNIELSGNIDGLEKENQE